MAPGRYTLPSAIVAPITPVVPAVLVSVRVADPDPLLLTPPAESSTVPPPVAVNSIVDGSAQVAIVRVLVRCCGAGGGSGLGFGFNAGRGCV